MEKSHLAVRARGLEKHFGDTHALSGIDLDVERGSVLGLLGPNGAGKTTAVRIFATLLRPDGGTAEVAGYDVVREPEKVRARIGLIGQAAAVDEMLTGRENLTMFARIHGLSRSESRRRADELLDQFSLTDAAHKIAKEYSGGMRRRLDIAAGIVVPPAVLFLDEPTTGLDPASRIGVWEFVQQLTDNGTTVLLTTQYLDEADQLANRIIVIDRGSVIAQGTSSELKADVGGERVEVVAESAEDLDALSVIVQRVSGEPSTTSEVERRVISTFPGGARKLPELVREIDAAGIVLDGLELRPPTLDDVFLSLTGHATDSAESKEVPA